MHRRRLQSFNQWWNWCTKEDGRTSWSTHNRVIVKVGVIVSIVRFLCAQRSDFLMWYFNTKEITNDFPCENVTLLNLIVLWKDLSVSNYFYYPLKKLREGNLFSHLVQQVSPCDHHLWFIGPHCSGPLTPFWTWWLSSPQPTASRYRTWDPPTPTWDWLPPDMRHTTPACTPYWWHLSTGHHWRPVQTCSLDLTVHSSTVVPHPLTRSKYGWQAGGTHPTEMVSCLFCMNLQ